MTQTWPWYLARLTSFPSISLAVNSYIELAFFGLPPSAITEKCFTPPGSDEILSNFVAATPVVIDPAIPKQILLDKPASI